jgi:hypothetical protein
MPELLSRIRALIRRPPAMRGEALCFEDLAAGRSPVQTDLQRDGANAFPEGSGGPRDVF